MFVFHFSLPCVSARLFKFCLSWKIWSKTFYWNLLVWTPCGFFGRDAKSYFFLLLLIFFARSRFCIKCFVFFCWQRNSPSFSSFDCLESNSDKSVSHKVLPFLLNKSFGNQLARLTHFLEMKFVYRNFTIKIFWYHCLLWRG